VDAGPPPDPGLVPAIERAALWAWPPRELRHLDGWLLRASGDASRRTNSVQTLAFGAPAARLAGRVGQVEAWYGERGRAACFQLTALSAPDGLDDELDRRGYGRVAPTVVMLADADRLPAAPEGGGELELLHRPTQAVLNVMADPLWGDPARRERAALLARVRWPHRFGLLSVGGEPAAGGLVVADDGGGGGGGLAGLFALRTQPPFRGRGLGRRLVLGLAAWARAQGCRRLYLQVEEANRPAAALYGALGFAPAYRYWYRLAGRGG
jgi:N-acetylglutamate synthase